MASVPRGAEIREDPLLSVPSAGAVGAWDGCEIRYLVLKYTEDTPLYDERFVNYGYNKIEFIEQLKYYRGQKEWS